MPTLQEEYDVLAGELRGLNVRLDLPEDDGISQAQPIGAEYDALAGELRGLNARLGLPENDGIPLTSFGNSEYENLVQQNNALDQRLSTLFPAFDEWNAEQDKLDKRSNWEATKTFADNFITGAGALAEEGAKAVKEVATGKAGWDSLGGIWEVGKRDFVRFAKTLGGAAEDLLPTTESERSREYRRAKENFDYYQTVRPLMVDAVGGDAKNLVSFGGQFVDPFMVFPVAGVAAKAGAVGLKSARLGRAAAALDKVGEVVSLPSKAVAAATRKGLKGTAYVAGKSAGLVGAAGGGVAKLAGLPRELTTKLAKKVLPEAASEGAGGALFASQIFGGASGMLPGAAELGIGEIAGFIANRTGKGLGSVLTTLAAPGAQQRFLQRLAQTAESPRMRRLALIAHRKGLTKAGDVAFNSLVNGASIASINGALAYLSGESAEGIGQAAGAGMVMGGVMPFGQPGQKAGKAQSSRDAASINYLEGKLASEQVKEFRKLEPEARLIAATAEEAGIPIPKLFFVDSKMFLDLMRQDDPNAREAQSAMYDPKDKTIYVNQDISSKSSSRAVMQMFTEELGHHFITEAIKTDPMFGHQILAEYKAKEGEKSHTFIFERDPDGNPLRTIEINEKGKKLADAYSSISDDVNVGIGNNANTLAQEIGAAQFSIMMDENPNLFPHLAQPIRHKLVNASQKILSLIGITDKFGNTLPLNIASKLKRSPAIRNLYRNYLKQREMHMAGKIDLAEKGQSIPLKRGESAQAGAERMFGATGLSLKDAKAFIINNRQIKRELTNLKNRYQDAPADGWSVVGGKLHGKKLTPDMRVIFTRTNPDPRGSVNIIINDIQAAIADNGEVNFLYRSGKPSKYSDHELKVRVVAPVGFEISGMAGKGAATLYMQAMDIAYLKNNVEVLVQEGFIKNPDKFIAEARQVAKEANAAGSDGRINPKGKFENELITVALGNKASVGSIFNPKLQALLESGRLKHSFRMYRIGELAGIALTGRPGIGFDWLNVKRNYSPHGRNFMPRRKPGPDDTIPLPFDELPGDIPGEGFGRMINVDKSKSEIAKAKVMADEQDGFSNSGTVRAKNADGRDKLFMPAAYHGTPHTFKAEEGAPLGRFRSAQIGTGEGAQAYGHGLYFAGKRDVAEYYRKTLARIENPNKWREKPNIESFDQEVNFILDDAAIMSKNNAEFLKDLEALETQATSGEYEYSPSEVSHIKKAVSLVKSGDVELAKGSLYKVELAPKENEYLLWDKPLSEQPKGVREKLERLAKTRMIPTKMDADYYVISDGPGKYHFEVQRGRSFVSLPNLSKKGLDALIGNRAADKVVAKLKAAPDLDTAEARGSGEVSSLGKSIYNEMARDEGLRWVDPTDDPQASTSAALREAGIPGIKYLEGASRKKGEGDYNYVIFDEADVAITEKLFMPASGKRVDQIKAKYPSVKLDIYGDAKKGFELSRIVVPKDERSSGLGTAVMDDIIKMADDQGAVISLTPDMSFGGSSVSRLKEFYKKFGFVENKGRNKDFSTRNTMIRPATDKLFMPASEAGATKGKVAEAATLWNEKGIDSPYFKKWFGKSKVVDDNGEPLVVYHGTDKEFSAFDPEKSIGGQHWFTSDRAAVEAGDVGAQGKGIILENFLSIEKPAGWAENDRFSLDELLGRGYDGLILPEKDGTATFVAFSPEQIKSATGNRGTFDAGDPNMLYMPAAKLDGFLEKLSVDIKAKDTKSALRRIKPLEEQLREELSAARKYTKTTRKGIKQELGVLYHGAEFGLFEPYTSPHTVQGEIAPGSKIEYLGNALDYSPNMDLTPANPYARLYSGATAVNRLGDSIAVVHQLGGKYVKARGTDASELFFDSHGRLPEEMGVASPTVDIDRYIIAFEVDRGMGWPDLVKEAHRLHLEASQRVEAVRGSVESAIRNTRAQVETLAAIRFNLERLKKRTGGTPSRELLKMLGYKHGVVWMGAGDNRKSTPILSKKIAQAAKENPTVSWDIIFESVSREIPAERIFKANKEDLANSMDKLRASATGNRGTAK